MNWLNELLEKKGLKWEDLNSDEKDYLNKMDADMRAGVLTVERIRDYIIGMRDQLIVDVAKYDTGSEKDLLLKGRILNYTLLLGILTTPEKRKKQIEAMLGNVVG